MKKFSALLIALVIALALLCLKEPAVPVFGSLTQTSSASETNKLAEQYFGRAIALLKQMDYQEAIAEYKKVISLLPNSEIALDAQYWIGQSYFRMGRHDQALSIFKKLIADYPGSAIVPVTKLMITRVQKEKENEKLRSKRDATLDRKVIIDQKTGAKYYKIVSFTGRKDVINYPSGLQLSPNGKFLLRGNLVIPLEEGEPFNLVNMDAWRGIWSPNGKKVAFYTREGAIWLLPVSPETGRATGPAKKLIDNEFYWQGPVNWSPDSEKIVFPRRGEESKGDIWILSIKDGTLTQITDDPTWEGAPKWSPDGKTIVYICKDFEVRIVSAEGGKSRKIIDYGRPFCWSPDGKGIIFDNRANKLSYFRLADDRVLDIDLPDGVGRFFSWSPDGKKMLFYHPSYDYTCVLRVVSTSGGPSFQLGRELELWPYVHYWSLDSKIIITTGGELENISFWMIPLAGGEAMPIDLDVSGISQPKPRSLSPDCRKLLFFEKQGDDKEDLYVVSFSLKNARTTGTAVMIFKGRNKKPVGYGRRDEWAWSPDGKKLALVHRGDIWITSAQEGKPVRITKAPEYETYPVWSPDGKMIAYIVKLSIANEIGGEQSLHVVSSSGGKSKKILNTSGKEQHAWSPNGKELAVISEGKISVVPIAGGKAREIFDIIEFQIKRVQALSWLPDGKHFAFIGEKEKEYGIRNRIYLVSEKGDKVIELAADDENWKDWLYPSPDGKWISYDSEGTVKVRSEGSIWEVNVEELIREEKK